MEFLRFGSSIPGSYWGCCACDIIQNFHTDPDSKAAIEIVDGDGGNTTGKFVGMTELDIFKARLRFGTFSTTDMPNHAFIAIMTQNQIVGTYGKKWLSVLKEHGFEFIRSVDNSVYSGPVLGQPSDVSHGHVNHIFMLIRNIGFNAIKDPFTPPKAWTDLSSHASKPEAWEFVFGGDDNPGAVTDRYYTLGDTTELTMRQHEFDTEVWNALGPPKFYSEKEVEKAGATVWYAGVRNKYPQEPKDARLTKKATEKLDKVPSKPSVDPFGLKAEVKATLAEAFDSAPLPPVELDDFTSVG